MTNKEISTILNSNTNDLLNNKFIIVKQNDVICGIVIYDEINNTYDLYSDSLTLDCSSDSLQDMRDNYNCEFEVINANSIG